MIKLQSFHSSGYTDFFLVHFLLFLDISRCSIMPKILKVEVEGDKSRNVLKIEIESTQILSVYSLYNFFLVKKGNNLASQMGFLQKDG